MPQGLGQQAAQIAVGMIVVGYVPQRALTSPVARLGWAMMVVARAVPMMVMLVRCGSPARQMIVVLMPQGHENADRVQNSSGESSRRQQGTKHGRPSHRTDTLRRVSNADCVKKRR